MPKVRYAAWHVTEPGYMTAEEAQKCCDRQENPEEWRVVATTDEFVVDEEAEACRRADDEFLLDSAVRRAVREEHRRIADILGLRL